MQIYDRKAEVFVPRTHAWWTFLALAADDGKFAEISFVSQLTPGPGTAIVDSRLLSQAIPFLKGKSAVILLWDGYRSYLEQEGLFEHASRLAAQIELCTVGDISDFRPAQQLSCRPLFSQRIENYSRHLVSEKMRRATFPRRFGNFALRHRSRLISGKVLLQLIAHRRFIEYKKTKFAYCGSNGLPLIERYSVEYQNAPTLVSTLADSFSELDFVSHWMSAIHQKNGYWVNQIIVRALLRFIALRALNSQRKQTIFLNIYPQPNINVYQAGLLFRNHVFLDFGGSIGDETVYPRFADMLFLNRQVVRFDMKTPAAELLALKPQDRTGIDEFLTHYREFVILQLDEGARIDSQGQNVGQGLRLFG